MGTLIVITGSPGTGKSTLAKKYEKKGYFRLDLHDHYDKISTGFDKEKDCYDIDIKKFTSLVRKVMKEHDNVVVDSHVSHLLPPSIVDECIVMVCSDLKELKKRLIKRKYSAKKIRENLDAEIFQVCLMEAKERGHTVRVKESC
ncbi:TPA: AAA family ATPase, partial [Candidatus Woesearchaeota archaeon]|nr:kinase [archaeon]HIJ10670.1 AAA family ATPase [Candidatus Woesearchaeota archaeon]